jgi:hypothetical protein
VLGGYKLAFPMLAADDQAAGFTGLSIGAGRVYGGVAEAACIWGRRHEAPNRGCTCGFYCFHRLDSALDMACDTPYRASLLLEVSVMGRFIRYEDGFRYARQRVRRIRVGACRCGRPAVVLVDDGTGLIGWRRLKPACEGCAGWARAVTFADFAARVGPGVAVQAEAERGSVVPPPGEGDGEGAPAGGGPGAPAFAVMVAEVALLQARLDDVQAHLARMSGQA